jgi:glycosyltransferase involved in cell wall biosynthesis
MGATLEPQNWLRVADVYLSCSESEGMPLGPIEAVGSGVPALLSAIPGHAFLRRYCRQYPLAEPAVGAHELVGLLRRTDSDPATVFRDTWTESAELRAHYALDRMARRYNAVYDDVVAERP